MSSKFGKCPKCPAGTRETVLINGHCGYHHSQIIKGTITAEPDKKVKVTPVKQPTQEQAIQLPPAKVESEVPLVEVMSIVIHEEPKMTKVQTRKANTAHIDKMWLQNPGHCENCGVTLSTATDWLRRSAVAHIIPKRTFDSVARHPKNRWFACTQCHTDYDNKGWGHAQEMKVWPLVLERFELFKDDIKDTEWSFLLDVLRSKIDENGNKPV